MSKPGSPSIVKLGPGRQHYKCGYHSHDAYKSVHARSARLGLPPLSSPNYSSFGGVGPGCFIGGGTRRGMSARRLPGWQESTTKHMDVSWEGVMSERPHPFAAGRRCETTFFDLSLQSFNLLLVTIYAASKLGGRARPCVSGSFKYWEANVDLHFCTINGPSPTGCDHGLAQTAATLRAPGDRHGCRGRNFSIWQSADART